MKPPTTLILTRHDIAGALSVGDCIEAVGRAFALAALGEIDVPPVAHLPARGGTFHVKSAAYRSEPRYAAVKVNGNFPSNPAKFRLPTIQGAILLADADTGVLLAIMDSIEVTALRTGAATAVAARHLAPRPPRTATIIGCGVQGEVQLRSVMHVCALERVYVVDSDPRRSRALAKRVHGEGGVEVLAVDDFASVTTQSELVVTCTPSRAPLLNPSHVSPGTLVAAVGADNSDKQEIAADLMAHAEVVVDSLDQCAEMGDLHHAIRAGLMAREDVRSELGAVVAGQVRLELTEHDIVVFDSTGIAIQDVAAAAAIYERARADSLGHRVAFN